MSGQRVLGIEIGGTKLQAALGAADGRILERERGAVAQPDASSILGWIESAAGRLIQRAGRGDTAVAAIGVGFGGPVQTATGEALMSFQVSGWRGLGLKRWFEERFGLPSIVANDSNAAGWAEYRLGAGRGCRQFMYMNIGSGIGGALVIDGALYDGQGRGACEIGHCFVPDWTRAEPGAADKLENICSGWSIERRLRGGPAPAPGTALYSLCGGDAQALDCKMLGQAARLGDAMALAELDQVGRSVALALANAIQLFHPQRIAIGGGVALIGEPLFEPIRRWAQTFIFEPYRGMVEIGPCELMEDAVVCGALLLAGEAAAKG